MSVIRIEGGNPLIGTVKVSGAKNSVLKIIPAAMFSNEDIILDNVPRIGNVEVDLEVIRKLGGKAEWASTNRLVLNGMSLNSFEVPWDLGSKYRTAGLLVAPLVFRFGKAVIPKPKGCKIGPRPINRWIDVWETLGMKVQEDSDTLFISTGDLQGANINFKINTHMGTDNAIISALFVPGETIINNAAEESEVDDLIDFCNLMGGSVERIEPRRIKISGKNIFHECSFSVQGDRNEAVTFAIASLLTGGNITIKDINRTHLTAFVNVLTKMGCNYEMSKGEIRVWSVGEPFFPVDVTTSPAPGFMTDWQPLISLLLTQADGESTVHDTIYTDRFGYVKDLNRMGAKIELCKPTDVGLQPVISDDAYDFAKLSEPHTVAKIMGPTKLKGTKMNILDLRAGATLVLAACAAEGKSEVGGYDHVVRGYENFMDKLVNLGAVVAES